MFFATLSISKGGGPFLITQVKTTCSLHRRYSMESTNIWHIRNCMLFIFTCMKKTWLGLCFMEEKNICMQVESKAEICITFSTNLSVIVVTDTANIKHIFGGFLQLMGFDFNWVCRVPRHFVDSDYEWDLWSDAMCFPLMYFDWLHVTLHLPVNQVLRKKVRDLFHSF